MAPEEGGAAVSSSSDELDTYIYHLQGWAVAPMLTGFSSRRDDPIVFLLFGDGSLSAGRFPRSFSQTYDVCSLHLHRQGRLSYPHQPSS